MDLIHMITVHCGPFRMNSGPPRLPIHSQNANRVNDVQASYLCKVRYSPVTPGEYWTPT